MAFAATILAVLIGLLHLYIMAMEMLLWQTPRVRKSFGTTAEFAAQSKTLAANQGLYNGFLAAALLWGAWQGSDLMIYGLICVAVAGIYGGLTVSKRIFFIQTVPAVLALMAVFLG